MPAYSFVEIGIGNASELLTIKKGKLMNILLADDDPMSLLHLSHMLEDEGHQVHTVNDGWEVLQEIEKTNFDLIISDIFMPQISGLLLGNLVKQFYPMTVPVLLISGQLSNEVITAGLKIGAAGFLAKPVDKKVLLRMIDKIMLDKMQGGDKSIPA
jgi:CheY-like chemotaxis protein